MIAAPFTPLGYGIAAFVMLVMAGAWFTILSAIWYSRSRDNFIWSGITATMGWVSLCAGFYGLSPIAAVPSGTVVTVLAFVVGYMFLELNQGSVFPIPRVSTVNEQINEYEFKRSYKVPYETNDSVSRSESFKTSSKPRYWGSWKGQVIRAIAEARTPLTLQEIISSSGLQPNAAAIAILELLEIGAVRYENDETHTVEPQLYYEYREYIERNLQKTPEYSPPAPMPRITDEHKHRTNNGEMVRSKSEVIVANTLAQLGLYYEYEKRLANPMDDKDVIKPDFTIHHGGKIFYWEHLGMLQKPEYRMSWEWKMNWYRKCGYEVITSRDGDDGSIDSQTIEAIAIKRILQSS
jgi:hypothetical protein